MSPLHEASHGECYAKMKMREPGQKCSGPHGESQAGGAPFGSWSLTLANFFTRSCP